MEQKPLDLLRKKVGPTLLRFSLPFMLTSVLQMLYGFVDLWTVGNLAGTVDVSAVTIGSQIIAMLANIVIHFSTGVAMTIGSLFGKKDETGLRRATGTAVVLFSVLAIGVTSLLILGSARIIQTLHTPREAAEEATRYLRICLLGTPFVIGYNLICALLRGIGNSKSPLQYVAVACVVNVALDLLFVAVFRMGAAGTAVATVIAQLVSFAFALTRLKQNGIGYAFSRADIHYHKGFSQAIAMIGIPLILQSLLTNLSFLVITAVINGIGLTASAAMGVVEKLISIIMIPPIAIGSAVASMVAQNRGAQQYRRGEQCLWYGVGISLLVCALPVLLCWTNGTLLTGLLTTDAAVARAAAEYLKTYSIDCLVVCFVFVVNGYFTGRGQASFTMAHSLLATILLRIPATLLFKSRFHGSLAAIGCAAPLSSLASVAMCLLYKRKLGKQDASSEAASPQPAPAAQP